MKIVLKNIFICLVTFWKCYFSTTTHTKPTTTQQENHQNTTTHTTTTTKKKKSKIKGSWVRGSIKITQKIKITQRERLVRGFVALGRRRRVKDRFVVWRLLVVSEVEGSWVEGSGSKIGLWVHRSAKSKVWSAKSVKSKAWSAKLKAWLGRRSVGRRSAKSKSKAVIGEVGEVEVEGSLSSVFAHESRNGLKWKFSLQTISGSKPSKHPVNWNNLWKIYFPCATKHPHLWKIISGSDLKPKQTQPKWERRTRQVWDEKCVWGRKKGIKFVFIFSICIYIVPNLEWDCSLM